jgi:hypothetical protein
MSYRFADSLRAGSGWSSILILLAYIKMKREVIIDLLVHVYVLTSEYAEEEVENCMIHSNKFFK